MHACLFFFFSSLSLSPNLLVLGDVLEHQLEDVDYEGGDVADEEDEDDDEEHDGQVVLPALLVGQQRARRVGLGQGWREREGGREGGRRT